MCVWEAMGGFVCACVFKYVFRYVSVTVWPCVCVHATRYARLCICAFVYVCVCLIVYQCVPESPAVR